LKKSTKIGVSTAVIVGINAMIGAGIFSAPATLAITSGPVTLITYIFVIISVWFIALSLSRVAKMYPEEGSFYTYVKGWAGHKAGLFAASLYVIGVFIAMGLLTRIVGSYIQPIAPTYSPLTLGLILLSILVALNIFGAKLSTLGQRILISTTLFPILATILICLSKANFSYLVSQEPVTANAVLTATKSVIFGFFGFEAAASLFSVVKNPEKNVPKALTYSILFVGILYFIFIGSIIVAVPKYFFTSSDIKLSTALLSAFPAYKWFIGLIHFATLSAIAGTLHSMIWSCGALTNSLSKKFGKEISRKNSILFVGLSIAIVGSVLTSPDLFFSLTALFIVSAFMMSMMKLLFIKEEWSSGRNIVTLLGMISGAVMVIFAIQGIIQGIA